MTKLPVTDRPRTLVADGADLLALVELALGEARALGASQAEAAISMDVGLSVSARLGEVETVEYQRDRGMGVTVFFGTRKGTASTGDLTRSRCEKPWARPARLRNSRPRIPAPGCRTRKISRPRSRNWTFRTRGM